MYDARADTPGRRYTVMLHNFVYDLRSNANQQLPLCAVQYVIRRLQPNMAGHPVHRLAIEVKESMWMLFG